jgi:hypothetical protein
MKIGPLSNHQAPDPDRSAESAKSTRAETDAASRRDRVEISGDGRSKLAQLADSARLQELRDMQRNAEEATAVNKGESQLTNGRLEQIRLKILSGYYDSPDVKARIADRLSDEMNDD